MLAHDNNPALNYKINTRLNRIAKVLKRNWAYYMTLDEEQSHVIVERYDNAVNKILYWIDELSDSDYRKAQVRWVKSRRITDKLVTVNMDGSRLSM